MSEVLKKFGKYFLLDRIAQGGMAEIYRARLASHDGAARLLVIKRVQAEFGGNKEFLQMFQSEIKVTMGFNHPNIVQLYDFGEEDGQPYIAMEFVDGRNLRQFLSRASELKQTFPVEVAAYIIGQAASGLHYAHSFKDKMTGQSLSIVHRDISPQNILISYDGNAKVIDFGIAKAKSNNESTRAGVIKGKPSYLSPEQITGEPLDGRCDLFALGIVLWELLAGQKLFAGDNDLAVLKLIESCNQHVKPPSKFNSAVTKELDYIVLKMLAKDREKRYQSGEEIQRALHKFLYAFNPDFNPGDLAYVAKDMFKNEIVEDRKKLKRLNDKAEQLLTTEAVDSVCSSPGMKVFSSAEDSTMVVETQEKEQIRMKPTRQSEGVSKANSNKIKAANKIELEDSNPSSVGAVLPKATGPVYASSAPTNSKLAPRQRPSSIGRPKQSGGGFFRAVLFVAVGISALVFFGPELGLNLDFGLKLPKLDFLAAGKSPVAEPTRAVRVEQDAGVSEKGVLLKLNIIPGGNNMSVAVNGRSLDPKNSSLRVPLDTLMELSVERVGFKGIRREFTLGAEQVGNSKEWTMDIALEPLQFGYVTLRSTPSAEATIVFEGYPWVRKIPIENEKFAVGTYQVKLRNELLGMEKDISFVVQNGKTLVLDERLSIKN